MTTSPTECQGTWGFPRPLPESDVEILTCRGCREIWAIDHTFRPGRGQWNATFPPGTDDMTITRRFLEDNAR
jgi:hypothetical protein